MNNITLGEEKKTGEPNTKSMKHIRFFKRKKSEN